MDQLVLTSISGRNQTKRWRIATVRGDAGASVHVGLSKGVIHQIASITSPRGFVEDIGWAWSERGDAMERIVAAYQPDVTIVRTGNPGFGYRADAAEDVLGTNVRTVVVTAGNLEHTLKFDLSAGGIIDSWVVNLDTTSGPGTEIINRGGTWTRGIQAGMSWADPTDGEFRKRSMRQGGDRSSELADHSQFASAPLSSITVDTNQGGSTLVTCEVIPIEHDPDGHLAVPGLLGVRGGTVGKPVIYPGSRIRQKIWINWRGIANVHRVEMEVDFPEEVTTAFFDLDLYSAMFLDADQFPELWAYDVPSTTETQLSNGVVGNPNYQAEYRTYSMNRSVLHGDDEVAGVSVIPSGRGGLAFRGSLASDLAVMVIGDCAEDNLTEPDRSVGEFGGQGTGWKWCQNRAVASGRDGRGTAMLSYGEFLTARFHPIFSVRRIPADTLSSGFWIATDTWTNCKSHATKVVSV